MKKKYIFTLVDSDNERSFGTILTFRRGLLVFFLFLALCTAISFPLAGSIHHTLSRSHMSKLQMENRLLKETFVSWNQRISHLESNLETIIQKNDHLRTMAAHGTPESAYGVGGPMTLSRVSVTDLNDLIHTSERLKTLEAEVSGTYENIKVLEQALLSRIKEIEHYPSIRPVKGGWFSSFFGDRIDPFTRKRVDHPGLDISLPVGSPVFSSARGIVKSINHKVIKNKGYGKYVIIEHGFGYETLYGHLSKIEVKKGQKINRWDIIGYSGDTGKSTAPHLHYGIYARGKPQNPLYFILD